MLRSLVPMVGNWCQTLVPGGVGGNDRLTMHSLHLSPNLVTMFWQLIEP
jgi:hypothetical protein